MLNNTCIICQAVYVRQAKFWQYFRVNNTILEYLVAKVMVKACFLGYTDILGSGFWPAQMQAVFVSILLQGV